MAEQAVYNGQVEGSSPSATTNFESVGGVESGHAFGSTEACEPVNPNGRQPAGVATGPTDSNPLEASEDHSACRGKIPRCWHHVSMETSISLASTPSTDSKP